MCPCNRSRRLSFWVLHSSAALLLAFVPNAASAADTSPSGTSLDKVPADAEAYGAMLRMGETIDIIGKSRAWHMIWTHPDVQEFWKKAQMSWDGLDGDWAPLKKFLADPANKELPALLGDAFSQEAFVYLGAGWGDLLRLGQEVTGMGRFGTTLKKLAGAKEDKNRAHIRLMLQSLVEERLRLRIPEVVIGFKVSDPAKVTAQLKRLDPLLADALKETPLKGRSQRVKVGDDEFLVLKLDGSLIPWDEIPLDMFEDKPGEFKLLLDQLKKMKLNVSVGVRQGYLLIALSDSPEQLAKFGGQGQKLIDRPEFKPLAKYPNRPLTSVGYTSAKLRQATATSAEDIKGLADFGKAALEELDLPKDEVKAIGKDLDALAKAIGTSLDKPGAATGFTFRAPRGWETFSYDFTKPEAGPKQPLTLLNHLGGDPLLAAVWRSETTVKDYQALVKWLTVFGKHAEKIAEAKLPDGKEVVKKYRADVVPLLTELSSITEKLWLPALADGQEAFVLDAKWTSKQWHAIMPPPEAPLPMLEFGGVVGVSDSVKLEKALEGYRGLANKLLIKARGEVPAGTIPDFEIGKPRIERKNGNTFADYAIPAEWGIDDQFLPTGGLSDKVAALTLSRGHTERLLKPTPLKIGSPLLADAKQPLDSMFHFNWAGLVDAAAPWVHYGMKLSNAPAESEERARKIIRALKIFRSYTSITYREADATVTRSEAVFRDVEIDVD